MDYAENKVTVSVQMKTAYMFDFLYWHSYSGFMGIINYGFSLAAVVALCLGFGKGDAMATIALVVLALLFTVINPLLLLQKADKQVKRMPMFRNPILYSFDQKGFTVTQDGESAEAEWAEVVLVRETKKTLALYLGAANAIVLPKEECGEAMAEIKRLLKEARPAFAPKLKK